MQRAWTFQDPKQKAKLGDKCPWSVGWYDPQGRRRQKSVGSKSQAEKYCRRVEGELAAGVYGDRKRVKWSDFRTQFADVALAGKAKGTAVEYANALDSFERIVKLVYMDTITTKAIDTFKVKRAAEKCRRRVPKDQAAGKPIATKRRRELLELSNTSPATVNKELRHIRAALRKARKWGMLAEVPEIEMLKEPQHDPDFIDDATFKSLYEACDKMTRPGNMPYEPADWWRALLCFAYMTGWRIGEILELRREDLDLTTGVAKVAAEVTKGRREARIELPAAVIAHLKGIEGFADRVFEWPHHERTLWADFAALKVEAGATFAGAFHRFRFGFANANVDSMDANLLQQLMGHQDPQTTRHYINAAARMKRSGIAERIHVPAFLQSATG
jgi:integrase